MLRTFPAGVTTRGLPALACACVPLAVAPLAAARRARAADAPERVTAILASPRGRTFGTGYTYAGGGCRLVTIGGRLPVEEIDGERAVRIEVATAGGHWGVGIARSGWVRWYLDDYVPAGVLEFRARGAKGGERFLIGVADSDTDGDGPDTDVGGLVPVSRYGGLAAEWRAYAVPIRDLVAASERKLRLDDCIKVLVTNDGGAQPQAFHLKDVRFRTRSPERAPPPWKLDQLGYLPRMRKVAKVSAGVDGFRVVDEATGRTVLEGHARKVRSADPVSGDDVWEADFSRLRRAGKYRIEAEGLDPSPAFEVRRGVYDALFRDAVRFYYLQRCGVALPEEHTGRWAREACHLGDRKAVPRDGGEARDVTGGWHDAGDCNKYPPWVRFPVFMMLDLYEMRPEAFADGELGIPESGNGVPDVLDEAKWELDWLIKMQIASGPRAGDVFDRIHQSAAPAGEHARLQEERRLLPPTAQAAAMCAAVWARAARTFGKIPELEASARRYLEAAKLSYARIEGDRAEAKLVLTASACLHDTTGEEKYLAAVKRHLGELLGDPGNVAHVDRFIWADFDCSVVALAASEREGGGVRETAREFLRAVADKAVEARRADAYSVPLWNPDHYCWSSNQIIGKMSYYALMANAFAPREEYVRMAEDVLHYMLGRNAVGYSMVTGYGERHTDVYHSIYGGSSHAWQPLPPGVMPGGVNQWESRGISAWPSRHYRSDPNNWTLTEPAIYYNAPLVFLSGYFSKVGRR